MATISTKPYSGIVSTRIEAERLSIAAQWLSRLNDVLTVAPNDVFPSDQLLDHIPTLIAEIAAYVRAPEEEAIAANAAVIDKARELGSLRHRQQASVHQLLREYEILGELLEAFIAEETTRLGLKPTTSESFEVLRRVTRATRTLMRTTVDTFVSDYTTTIQERNERIQNFNRMASHELRSPIGTLLFAAAMLDKAEAQADPQRLHRIAATISSNAERLSRLVTNLERMSRLADSSDVPSQQETDVHALCTEVARQLDEMRAARDVEIKIDPSLRPLLVDPARLELVVLNLLSNAIKYVDPEKPLRRIDVDAVDDGNEGVYTLVIRDNGLGIAEEDQASIFDRFFRAHAHLDDAHRVSGTGLGLAIVMECILELGGSIDCRSAVGQGTTFIVKLPTRPPGTSDANPSV